MMKNNAPHRELLAANGASTPARSSRARLD